MAGLHQYAFCMPNQVPAPHGAGNTPSGYQANPNNRALTANAAELIKDLDESEPELLGKKQGLR